MPLLKTDRYVFFFSQILECCSTLRGTPSELYLFKGIHFLIEVSGNKKTEGSEKKNFAIKFFLCTLTLNKV